MVYREVRLPIWDAVTNPAQGTCPLGIPYIKNSPMPNNIGEFFMGFQGVNPLAGRGVAPHVK